MDVKALTPPEAAYIAGLIDGEGTITLTRERDLVLPACGSLDALFAQLKPQRGSAVSAPLIKTQEMAPA